MTSLKIKDSQFYLIFLSFLNNGIFSFFKFELNNILSYKFTVFCHQSFSRHWDAAIPWLVQTKCQWTWEIRIPFGIMNSFSLQIDLQLEWLDSVVSPCTNCLGKLHSVFNMPVFTLTSSCPYFPLLYFGTSICSCNLDDYHSSWNKRFAQVGLDIWFP